MGAQGGAEMMAGTASERREGLKLDALFRDPLRARQYAERYLNDGSPSGFSTRFTTSEATSPFGLTPWFNLFRLTAPPESIRSLGEIPNWPAELDCEAQDWLLIHPDMAEREELQHQNLKLFLDSRHRVIPTASGRTVQFTRCQVPDYVKLHYEGTLGRVRRHLPFYKAATGPEVGRLIMDAIDQGILDERVSILPEPGARSVTLRGREASYEWGMTWRSHRPYGRTADEIAFFLPAFALFSTDRLASYDPELLEQIIASSEKNPATYVMTELIEPAIECYFSMISVLGLQPEWNAQNLLFGFDESLRVVALITRDLESIDRDVTLRESMDLPNEFAFFPYKCIHQDQYNYRIKHSFMFDHKLGDYVLDPILSFVSDRFGSDLVELRQAARDIADVQIRTLPGDFFPEDGCWYMFERVLVDQEKASRPYIAIPNPKFRSCH